MKQKTTRIRKTISIISFVLMAAIFIVIFIAAKPLIEFISDTEAFQAWVNGKGVLGYFIMIGLMCLQVVVAILPGEMLEIAAGFAYGAVPGMMLCLLGAALGSFIIILFTKLFGKRMVEAFIPEEKIHSLSFLKNSKKLTFMVFLFFFIPGTPKDIITYFIGLTPMKLSTFLLVSSVARIPSVITSTICGHALGANNITIAASVFAVTAILSLVGLLSYHRITKSEQEKEEKRKQKKFKKVLKKEAKVRKVVLRKRAVELLPSQIYRKKII